MKTFLIVTNYEKDEKLIITKQVQNYLEEHGCKCYHSIDLNEISDDVEAILVLGGDGTLIQAAHDIVHKDLPLLGINLGTLGYLTEVGKDNIYEALDALLEDNYEIEERMMIEGQISRDGLSEMKTTMALNEIVLTRAGGLRVVNYHIYVNDEYLATYEADGIIVATPTGSTGYSMSAGGPIIAPCSQMSVITPICPHTLNNRSIVLAADDKITITVEARRGKNNPEAMVSFDATYSLPVEDGDCIKIKKAKATTKIIKINKDSFLQILSKKMSL